MHLNRTTRVYSVWPGRLAYPRSSRNRHGGPHLDRFRVSEEVALAEIDPEGEERIASAWVSMPSARSWQSVVACMFRASTLISVARQ